MCCNSMLRQLLTIFAACYELVPLVQRAAAGFGVVRTMLAECVDEDWERN
jgi:hypothetical protein